MSTILQIPTTTAPSKLTAVGQLSGQLTPLLFQKLAAISGGQLTSPPTSSRPFVATIGSDSYKLLSAFAGRPISNPSNTIFKQNITHVADLRYFRPVYKLEDLDQIKLRALGGASSDTLSLQNLFFGDTLVSKVLTRIEDKLGIDITSIKDSISSVTSPLLQFGTKALEPFRNLSHSLADHPKKYSEPNAQIYERAERKPKTSKKDQNSLMSKSTKLRSLKDFATTLLLQIRKWLP